MIRVVLAALVAIAAVAIAYFGRRRPFLGSPKLMNFAVYGIAGLVVVALLVSTSFTVVSADKVGHLKRVYGGGSMPAGHVVAAEGENGPQAEILAPGFHFRPLLNVMYEVEEFPIVEIPADSYGLLIARDGAPLRENQFLASAWPEAAFQNMLDAEYFLKNGGQKGSQLSVLSPGKYRINQYLFEVKLGKATDIEAGVVGVVKSNVQEAKECKPIVAGAGAGLAVPLVPKGCIGVWNEPLYPGRYYLNELAYQVTKLSTRVGAWEYKGGYTKRSIDLTIDQKGEIAQRERSEEVPVPDSAADPAILTRVEGWNVPLELRVLVQVEPTDAPYVVASVGGVEEIEDRILTPVIRSVVRNVVGGDKKVRDLLDRRAELEDQVEKIIIPEGRKAGISIKEIRFGDPAIPPELLIAHQREQLADQLKATYQREKEAQDERIKTEKARAEADRQGELVAAEISVQVAEQNKQAAQKEGEGEKLRLLEIASGQKAQAEVLGQDRVLQLAMLKEILAAAAANPDIVKVPQVLVQGPSGGLEGAAAVLGSSNLMRGMESAAGK